MSMLVTTFERALAREIDAAIEAEQVNSVLAAHLVHRLVVGKIDHGG